MRDANDLLICQTPRLILRRFELNDIDELMAVHSDPEVMRFSVGGVKAKEEVVRFIENSKDRHRTDGHGQWAIIWKDTAQCIGECGISPQQVGGVREHEISYRLNRNFWGRGIATEAANACVAHAFEALRLDRVVSIIDALNVASIRVAEKIGMKREKTSVFYGSPVVVYGISHTSNRTALTV